MIKLPDACLRHLSGCQPLAQIESDDSSSFICCGINGRQDEDRFRLCWVNQVIDEMSDWSERDIKDTTAVMAQALSVDTNMRGEI